MCNKIHSFALVGVGSSLKKRGGEGKQICSMHGLFLKEARGPSRADAQKNPGHPGEGETFPKYAKDEILRGRLRISMPANSQ